MKDLTLNTYNKLEEAFGGVPPTPHQIAAESDQPLKDVLEDLYYLRTTLTVPYCPPDRNLNTERLREVWDYFVIATKDRKGVPPTMRNIIANTSLASLSMVSSYLKCLTENMGLLEKDGRTYRAAKGKWTYD